LVGRLRSGGDPDAYATEDEVRELFAPYGAWAGLAATHALVAANGASYNPSPGRNSFVKARWPTSGAGVRPSSAIQVAYRSHAAVSSHPNGLLPFGKNTGRVAFTDAVCSPRSRSALASSSGSTPAFGSVFSAVCPSASACMKRRSIGPSLRTVSSRAT